MTATPVYTSKAAIIVGVIMALGAGIAVGLAAATLALFLIAAVSGVARKIYYTDEADNQLVFDNHGKLTGYNAEGEMLSIPELKRVARESKLDITFHHAPSVESGYLAKMDKELLE